MQQIRTHYDLVVIGAGPGGTPIAVEYAKLNSHKTIALVDALGELGGECLFQGCIPSKIIEASAKHIRELESLKSFGVTLNDSSYQLTWEKIKERKDEILSRRTAAAKVLASEVGNIDIIKGFGSFESETAITIALEDGLSQSVTFQKAIIATGSKSIVPEYEGDAAGEIMTNDQFFHEMVLPKSLSIIGSGAIAVEFAQILAMLGTKITLFARGDRILKNIDDEASDALLEILQKDKNITVLLNAAIQAINHKDGDLEIRYVQDGISQTLLSQKIMSAAGRKPNIAGLGLENAQIDFTHKGITTTPALQTSNKNVFANGDVVADFPKFAHTAQYTAHIVAQNLFLAHNFFKPDFDKNAWVLFSMPNFAAAGLSQKEAEARNIEIRVDTFDFATEAKSQIEEEDFGYLKFVVEKKTKKIIGISIFHNEANTLGGEAALIVARGLTLKELIDTIHPHPTMSEAYVMLAKKMMGEIMLDTLKKPVVQALLKVERLL